MECRYGEALGRWFFEQSTDSFAHFFRGLIGKCDRQDVLRRNSALDKVTDPVSNDARLPAARASLLTGSVTLSNAEFRRRTSWRSHLPIRPRKKCANESVDCSKNQRPRASP